MATDTLEIFGTEYSGVTGVKATDSNNQTKTYIRPQGTKSISANGTGIDVAEYASVNVSVPSDAFIVTLSWDSVEELWMPDKTITALQDAYDNDEEIIFVCDGGSPAAWFYDDDYVFVYSVFSGGNNELILTYYIFTTQGVEEGTTDRAIFPSFDSPSVTYTPTESQQTQTITYNPNDGYNGIEEVSVTVNAISSNYVGTGITRRSSTDLTASGATVTVPSGYYSEQVSKAVSSGTAGTPTATKGTVSNHSVSVTPSVTNTSGYITGSTKTGTAVTVSASELVSGSETKTENGTYDVTNLAELVVDVSGGGSSSVTVGTKTATLSSTASSISFTGLSGNPTSFVVTSSADIATNTNGVTGVVYDGTSLHGQTMTTQVTADTGFAKSYSGGILTITATTASFQANEYKLVYTYNGSSSDIHTADVQVGSGATSIAFSSLSGRPVYWSCIFKSDFSTSSGYQRVIEVVNDGTNIYGMAMDSEANAQTSWTATYSGGNLTISSSSTNNGGYFHQPGYYQLTYAVDDSAPQYQTKTVSPTTSQQTVLPDSGYDALEEVIVNAMPTMTLPNSTSATSSGTSKATVTPSSSVQYLNIPTGYNETAQYYTISASGGGSSMNMQAWIGRASRTANSYGATTATLTVAKTGTYTVSWSAWRSSSSGTMGTNLHVNDTTGTNQQTFTNTYGQQIELTNQHYNQGDVLTIYATSGSNSRTINVANLIIQQTA